MKRISICLLIILLSFFGTGILSSMEFIFGTFIDPFFNLKLQQMTVDYTIEFPYGNNPQVTIDPIVPNTSLRKTITDNLDVLVEKGYKRSMMVIVEGTGEYYIDIPLLKEIVHEGFDYDSQYVDPTDPESELAAGLTEENALKRYVLIDDLIGFFISEAQKRGLTAEINIESLAHIINRANQSGIGGGDETPIADNLPPLTPEQVGLLLEQIHAAVTAFDSSITTYTVFEEAFDEEYLRVIAETTTRLGLTYRHTGPSKEGFADMWAAYYYAFYPLSLMQENIYRFLITLASTPPIESWTLGAARAADKEPMVVVGHYTPWPADPSLGVEVFYDPNRPLPIDANEPTDANGNALPTRTSGLQKNQLLYGLVSEHVTDFFISTDLDPSLNDFLQLSLTDDLLPRLNEFSFVLEEKRPLINVIIDLSSDSGGEMPELAAMMPEVLQFSLSAPLFTAIHAAGFEPWVTYNHPLQNENVSAYWIITPGGGELIESEGNSESPPLWIESVDLRDELLSLVDPQNPAPVILSVMAGIPNAGNWKQVRDIFGIPTGRGGQAGGPAFASDNLIDQPEFLTSIATNILTTPDGELLTDELEQVLTHNVLPDTIDWNGQSVRMHGLDPAQFGVFVNVIAPGEVPLENILLASHRPDQSDYLSINRMEGDTVQSLKKPAVFIFQNETGGKKVLINPNTFHLEMAYPLSNILCDITGRPRTLNHPALAYISGSETRAIFAIDDTQVDMNLQIEGDTVRMDRFDPAGNWKIKNLLTPVSGLFPLNVQRHELVILSKASLSYVPDWQLY